MCVRRCPSRRQMLRVREEEDTCVTYEEEDRCVCADVPRIAIRRGDQCHKPRDCARPCMSAPDRVCVCVCVCVLARMFLSAHVSAPGSSSGVI